MKLQNLKRQFQIAYLARLHREIEDFLPEIAHSVEFEDILYKIKRAEDLARELNESNEEK